MLSSTPIEDPAVTPDPPPTVPNAARSASRWSTLFLGTTLVAWFFGLPFAYIVLVTGPATVVVGVVGLVALKRMTSVAAVRVLLWLSISVGLMSTAMGVGLVALRDEFAAFAACNERAITESAKQACFDALNEALLERLGVASAG